MAKTKQPVTIWGIEFDALIDEQKNFSSTIPVYPVEDGFPVTDTIINDPISLSLSLYVSNTPVTWLYRHGSSVDRVVRICNQIEEEWMKKKLTKIVTSDAIYKDMGITSISIKKSKEIGYAREISVTAQKVRITQRKTVKIPSNILKSGKTMENAGKAKTLQKRKAQEIVALERKALGIAMRRKINQSYMVRLVVSVSFREVFRCFILMCQI